MNFLRNKLLKIFMLDTRALRCVGFSIVAHSIFFMIWLLFTAPPQGEPDGELIAVGLMSPSPESDNADYQQQDPANQGQTTPDPSEEETVATGPQDTQKLAKELLDSPEADNPALHDYRREQQQRVAEKRTKMAKLTRQQDNIQQRVVQRSRYGTLEPRSFYGVKLFERHLLFVIDISGSMDIEEACLQLRNSYHALGDKESFNIIAFNDNISIWKDKLVPAVQPAKDDADRWLQTLLKGSSTNFYDALRLAFSAAQNSRRVEAIYLVSDGLPTAGPVLDPLQILKQVVKWNQQAKIPIHTIGIGPHQDKKFLGILAEQSRGRYHVR